MALNEKIHVTVNRKPESLSRHLTFSITFCVDASVTEEVLHRKDAKQMIEYLVRENVRKLKEYIVENVLEDLTSSSTGQDVKMQNAPLRFWYKGV